MKPSEKNPNIDRLLTALFGIDRQASIKENVCVDQPIGCGQPISNFGLWSEIEQAEYTISGLCQRCQRRIFASNYRPAEEPEEGV
jgi:hypothetical protein